MSRSTQRCTRNQNIDIQPTKYDILASVASSAIENIQIGQVQWWTFPPFLQVWASGRTNFRTNFGSVMRNEFICIFIQRITNKLPEDRRRCRLRIRNIQVLVEAFVVLVFGTDKKASNTYSDNSIDTRIVRNNTDDIGAVASQIVRRILQFLAVVLLCSTYFEGIRALPLMKILTIYLEYFKHEDKFNLLAVIKTRIQSKDNLAMFSSVEKLL